MGTGLILVVMVFGFMVLNDKLNEITKRLDEEIEWENEKENEENTD